MRNNSQGSEEKVQELQDEIEQLSVWKDKVAMVKKFQNK